MTNRSQCLLVFPRIGSIHNTKLSEVVRVKKTVDRWSSVDVWYRTWLHDLSLHATCPIQGYHANLFMNTTKNLHYLIFKRKKLQGSLVLVSITTYSKRNLRGYMLLETYYLLRVKDLKPYYCTRLQSDGPRECVNLRSLTIKLIR